MTKWKHDINPEDISSKEGRNRITKNFLIAFHESINHCFSQKKICQHSKFWMTESIKKAIKNFKSCKRRNRKWCDPSSSQDLTEAKVHLDKLIQTETDRYWANYLQETGSTSGKNFWNKVKNVIDPRIQQATQPLKNQEGELEWDDDKIMDILVNTNIKRLPISKSYEFDQSFYDQVNNNNSKLLNSEGSNPNIFEKQITIKEIMEQISDSNGLASPGPPSEGVNSPGIPPILLKKSSETLSPFTQHLFNILWKHGDFPDVLKSDIKFFIPKPDKDDYSLPKSYRMLTLSMCISKLYDGIFSRRFSTWLEQINFDEDQYAYRRNLSCQHAIFKLVQHTVENFNKGNITILLLIDLEGAFDALWHQGMILQLYNEGIRGKILNLVWNILHNRTALVKVNDLNKSIPCTDTGACQGNSSAAVMFTFLIRKMMKNTSCNKIKYSDDGNLYISGPPEEAQQMANTICNDLKLISKWSYKWRMPINLSKTKYMILNRFDSPLDINISFDQVLSGNSSTIHIKRTLEERILGVIFDEQLTFTPHIDHLVNRSFTAINKVQDFSIFYATSRTSR